MSKWPKAWLAIMQHILNKYAEVDHCSIEAAALYLDVLDGEGVLKDPPKPLHIRYCKTHKREVKGAGDCPGDGIVCQIVSMNEAEDE